MLARFKPCYGRLRSLHPPSYVLLRETGRSAPLSEPGNELTSVSGRSRLAGWIQGYIFNRAGAGMSHHASHPSISPLGLTPAVQQAFSNNIIFDMPESRTQLHLRLRRILVQTLAELHCRRPLHQNWSFCAAQDAANPSSTSLAESAGRPHLGMALTLRHDRWLRPTREICYGRPAWI